LIYPKREDVEFLAGEDTMSSYRFGLENKPHRFCPTCGTSILIDFKNSDVERQRQYLAVNVSPLRRGNLHNADSTRMKLRIIEEIEELLPQLNYSDFDGKNKLGPPYKVPA
jgi:hypothetical protein